MDVFYFGASRFADALDVCYFDNGNSGVSVTKILAFYEGFHAVFFAVYFDYAGLVYLAVSGVPCGEFLNRFDDFPRMVAGYFDVAAFVHGETWNV